MSNNNGGPAFPACGNGNETWIIDGMTLRDYFAAKAMQGDISSMQAHENPAKVAQAIAARAYAVADAMLKVREL